MGVAFCLGGNLYGSNPDSRHAREALSRIEEIMREGQSHRPELVVVSDGNDTVGLAPGDLGQTRLHAFLVECDNRPLTDLAIKSGGVGIDRL